MNYERKINIIYFSESSNLLIDFRNRFREMHIRGFRQFCDAQLVPNRFANRHANPQMRTMQMSCNLHVSNPNNEYDHFVPNE